MKVSNHYVSITAGCRRAAVAVRVAAFALLLGAALPLAAQTTRDPLVQPFAIDSVWNMPIGSGAQYVAINMAGIPGNNVWAGMPQIDDDYIVFKPTAPLTAINYSDAAWTGRDRCPATGGLLIQVPMPANFVVPSVLNNNGAAFLLADNRTIIQTQPLARCIAGGPATSVIKFDSVDIYGDGRLGGHGGSALSTVGGTIRIGEFRPGTPIRHAIKIDIDSAVVLARCSSAADCFRWPAFMADAGAAGSYGTQNPNPVTGMKMGALLAIPSGTNINNLGLESVPGQMLAWTLQNYGAYIVDSTGGPGFVISAENGPDGSVRNQFAADFGMALEQTVNSNTPWSRDMQRLVQAMYLVDNNGPTSIGGGGTPLQPLALPLQLPGGADAIPPTVPGGLTAAAVSLQINLSWTASTDNVGVTGYKIFRNGVQIATTSSLTYADAGLLPLTLYSYAVAAYDAAGNTSAQSTVVSASTLAAPDTQAPTVPTGLAGTAVSSSQINLSWIPSTDNVGVTGYRVYRAGTLLAAVGAVTAYQNTALSASTSYSYTVQAIDAAGNASAQSASASATTTPVSVTTLPAPVTQAPHYGEVGGVHCFIATAAYGSPMASDVRYLRAFRDQYLLTNKFGQWFVGQYYRLSPPLADELRAHEGWRAVVRVTLSPLVALSKWLASDETFEKQGPFGPESGNRSTR
jgi:chitodextrinase